VLWVLVAIFVLGHLPFLASTLEDIDSVNFALGLHDFDVTKHQPHPPGYPVYILLGRVARQGLALVAPAGTPDASLDARALAFWGSVLGGLALLPLASFFSALEEDRRRALLATALTACAPLVWFDAGRPMSNMAGLALVWASQGMLLSAWRRHADAPVGGAGLRLVSSGQAQDRGARAPDAVAQRAVLGAAVLAGVAAGVRSQTVLSTLPLLGAVLMMPGLRRNARTWLLAAAGVTVGALAWAVPLVADSGGVGGYLAAFAAQAGEDIVGVDMLATNPSLRRLALGLVHTFVFPWGGWPLASLMLGLALFGVIVLAVRDRRALWLLAASCVPYLAFHLWLQETVTTRYALPIVPALAYAAVRGIDELALKATPVLVSMLVAASLATTVPLQWTYASLGSPLSRAVAEIRKRQGADDAPMSTPVVGMHHAFALALRGEAVARGALQGSPGRDTLQVVSYWLDDQGTRPVWFLADPRRSDLDRFDHATRSLRARFGWGFPTEAVLGGVRPSDVDLVEIREPGWMVGDGWALTPELAGQAAKSGRGLPGEPLVAHVRARDGAAQLMIGGRNLSGPTGRPVEFAATLDGRELERWAVPSDPGFFLKFWDLPAGALSSTSRWLPVSITASAADGSGGVVPAAVEQFDVQPAKAVVFGYDTGWYEPEFNPTTGRRWRWASESAALHVKSAGVGVRVRLSGATEFDGEGEAPTVRLRAGARELATIAAARGVNIDVLVPASVLGLAKGFLHLETTRVRIPSQTGESGDQRHLGVRVFSVEIFSLQDR
jgi:hypothetical protein